MLRQYINELTANKEVNVWEKDIQMMHMKI